MKNSFKILLLLSVFIVSLVIIKMKTNNSLSPAVDFESAPESNHVQAAEEIKHMIKQ